MASALPTQFGPYRLLHQLGEGATGTVYFAEDTLQARRVAVKRLHLHRGNRSAFLSHFLAQAQLATRIDHPNICPVLQVGEFAGVYYLTMPYIEGNPLAAYIDRAQPWPLPRIINLVCQLAHILHPFHQQGMIHQGLKPTNILLRTDGEPVLVDFGLSQPFPHLEHLLHPMPERSPDTEEQARHVIRSLPYLAPEQLGPDADVLEPATDIYSLGILLFELVTGVVPFVGSSEGIIAQISRLVPRHPSSLRRGLPTELDRVCLQCLAKRPEERFASVLDLANALQSLTPPDTATQQASAPRTAPDPAEAPGPARAERDEPSSMRRETALRSSVTPSPSTSRAQPEKEVDEPPEPERKRFACPACGKKLKVPRQAFTNSDVLRLRCPVCSRSFHLSALSGSHPTLPSPSEPEMDNLPVAVAASSPELPVIDLDGPTTTPQHQPAPEEDANPTEHPMMGILFPAGIGFGIGSLLALVLWGFLWLFVWLIWGLASSPGPKSAVPPPVPRKERIDPNPAKKLAGQPVPHIHLEPIHPITFPAGSTHRILVRVRRENTDEEIQVQVTGLSAEVTTAPGVIPGNQDQVQLEFQATDDARVEARQIHIRAVTRSGVKDDRDVSLSITPRHTIRIQSVPETVSLAAGAKGKIPVQIERVGYTGVVVLQAENLPTGVHMQTGVIPANTNTGTVSLRADAPTRPTTQRIQLRAVAGKLQAQANVTLTTTAPLPPAVVNRKLQGNWELKEYLFGGLKLPVRSLGMTLTIKGNRFTMQGGRSINNATYTTNTSRSPHTIDLKLQDGRDKGKTVPAIYELDGDQLRISMGTALRPRDFKPESGTTKIIMTFKRTR